MRYNPTDVTSTYASIAALNANFDDIQALFEKCVFTDGTAPNAMLAPLDLNHFSIKNVAPALDDNDAINKKQVTDLVAALTGVANALSASSISFAPTSTGAVTRSVNDKLVDSISTSDFGLVGDGSDETAKMNTAIAAAAAAGKWLEGLGKTYAVNGTINIPSNLWFRDASFKQLAPGATASVVTLKADTKDNVRLERIRVNRNGDGTNGGFATSAGVNGCLDTAFGIYITHCTNTHVRGLEVYGNDTGTGARFEGLDYTCSVDGVYCHDIAGVQVSGDGTDEAVCGIRLQDCTGTTFRNLVSINMKMTYGANPIDIIGTRGIAMGGMQRCRIQGYVKNVGTGCDVSSSNAQADCDLDIFVDTTYSYGVKLAHDVRRFKVRGRTYSTGDHGFFGQSAGDATVLLQDANIFEECIAVNPGGPKAGYVVNPSGFGFVAGGTNSIGALCRNCKAIDNQATHTMANGFYNEKVAAATCLVQYQNCEAVGFTNADFVGEHEDRCHVTLNVAAQSIPNNTLTEIVWDTELEDSSDLHSTGTAPGRVTIKRDGVYMVIGYVLWTGNATGTRQVQVQKGGATLTGAKVETSGQANNHTQTIHWSSIRLKAGDSLGLAVLQTSGGALNVVANSNETQLIVQRLSN